MRPVRFVALSEDGQALVLADELGRLLGLPLDERVNSAVRGDAAADSESGSAGSAAPERRGGLVTLSPRDIQTRIRSGESAEDIAKGAGVQVDKVLRYAGPVLQERAMLAQAARRARLSTSDRGERMSDVVDVKLGQHGVDAAAVSWDAWRREDGTWRVTATWTSGKSTAKAMWELDRSRQTVQPHDEMAQFLSTPSPASARKEPDSTVTRAPSPAPSPTARPSRDPLYGVTRRDKPETPAADKTRPASRPDPLRRDALRAALERPLGEPARGERQPAALGLPGSEPAEVRDTPSVPSLAVLRPRRNDPASDDTGEDNGKVAVVAGAGSKPRNRLPAWEDVLFGGDTTPRSSH
ncbi:Protein of unknown function (DUF3071) [Stackebrandtia albiflava]|uniref:DUF3071 domain-containing protein n=1 Tax=Stackebrandtia albiflava TaxID=406432 RepID=A0A562ULE0_9ACTN|nr:septation protein SepH [Stackebrandtia albiflava]TWJ06419.1 Protein of unknown function (DUF3071) [Stackebrandtia albiflava]